MVEPQLGMSFEARLPQCVVRAQRRYRSFERYDQAIWKNIAINTMDTESTKIKQCTEAISSIAPELTDALSVILQETVCRTQG
jgi:hypothetical protein